MIQTKVQVPGKGRLIQIPLLLVAFLPAAMAAADDHDERPHGEHSVEAMKEEARHLERRVEMCLKGAEMLGDQGNQLAAEILKDAAVATRNELRHLTHAMQVNEHGDHHEHGLHEDADEEEHDAHGDHEHDGHEHVHGPGHVNPEMIERLEHMAQAIEHLHRAGLPDIARHVAERAEVTEREIHERQRQQQEIHEEEHRPAEGNPDLMRRLQQRMDEMQGQIQRLSRAVERLSDR